jgi:hypothetical protein
MKLITESKSGKIGQEMLDLIESIIVKLECLNNDLQYEFGNDILNKKIGEGFNEGACKYSLRDRYGSLLDKLLNTSLSIAKSIGVNETDFRNAIDELIGDSKIYNGEYDSYCSCTLPSEESLELDKGSMRWWKAKP